MVMSLVPMTGLAAETTDQTMELSALKEALTEVATKENKTVSLTGNVTITAEDLTGLSRNGSVITVPADVTLNGNSYTITASGWTEAEKNSYHILSVENASEGTTTTIKDLTIVGNANTKSGIHAYNCAGEVKLENVNIQNCGNAAVQINGATVIAENLTTSGNAWGGVNVDDGSTDRTPSFTLRGENNNLTEPTKIWTELDQTETGNKNVITVPTGWATMTSVDGKTYYAANEDVAIKIGNTPYATLQDAVKAISENTATGKTITLHHDITVTQVGTLSNNQAAVTLPAGVTLDGQGHKITAIADWDKDKQNHILGVVSPTSDVTIQNVTIVGNENTKHGINAWSNTDSTGSLILTNVTIQNCGTAGMVVKGMTAKATNLTTSGNVWGAVNIDSAENSKLTLTNADLAEDVQVWTEMTEVPKDTISIEGTDFTMVTGAGKANDSSGLKGFTYYTTDLSKLGEASITTGSKTTVYATLADAIKAAQNSDTVTLLKDVPNATGITVSSGKNFTVDFGWYTYTLTGPGAGSTGTETNGFQLLEDSTITFKNGTIRIAENANTIKRIIQNYANLTLEDMHIYAENQVGGEDYALSFNCGSISFKGDTDIITSKENTIAFDVCYWETGGYPEGVTVTFDETYTGTINGKIIYDSTDPAKAKLTIHGTGYIGAVDTSDSTTNGTDITVSGGSFGESVAQYVADALNYEANNNGTYTYYETLDEALAVSDTVSSVEAAKDGANAVTVTVKNGNDETKITLKKNDTYKLPTLPNQGYNRFQGWRSSVNGEVYPGGQEVTITADTTFTAQWSYIPPANPNYKITIGAMENGTVTANPTAAKAGATVTLTATPDEGYALSTLTVTDRFGDAVRVTEQADGTYTFTMPNGQVTVTATFVETEAPVDEPFVDVAEGDWFYDAVVYAYQNELMDGVGGNRFAPNSETTRAQLVTILYRLEGQPAVSGDLPFTDVETGTWYTNAVLWAAQNGIVNGVTDTTFAPGDEITRQQLVTILYRYAEAKGYDVSASADLSGYPDADQVQDYAQPAMAWAVAENIIQGMEDGTLKPAGNASRAQIATILMRFCEDVAQ